MAEETVHLLVVDDDMVDRMSVRRALQKTDLNVDLTEASNCTEATRLLSDQTYSCLLLDYRLPDGTALDFIKTLKVANTYIPTIVFTGQGDEKIAVDLMKAGASDYVSKAQITPKSLARIIRSALRVHKAELEVEQANQRLRNTNLILKEQNQQLESQKQQIHLQNLELLEASRLKSEFLASMSHELRTPMHAIMGFAQILLQGTKGELSSSQTKMVERILDNSNNLLMLLNDLLDFSKVEAGQLTVERQEFNLAKLVTLTVEELKSLAIDKNLSLKIELELLNRKLRGDKGRLRQVMTNLISNAIKFTEAGEIVVSLYDMTEEKVAIAVQDTGIGIDASQQEAIFDPFVQANQSVSRKYPGTGLGLAISKSLVELMEGDIRVDSTLGEGATFTVVLPR